MQTNKPTKPQQFSRTIEHLVDLSMERIFKIGILSSNFHLWNRRANLINNKILRQADCKIKRKKFVRT